MMKYLSIDLEATGLNEHDYIIEFAMIPFDTVSKSLEESLSRHFFIHCPSFESLEPELDPWIIEHNKTLIEKAHQQGVTIKHFKEELQKYFESKKVSQYFANKNNEKIILFGKSMNAIDLPFLTRDLGWDFMRKYFHHRVLDLTSTANSLVDMNLIPEQCQSGSSLMQFLGMGEVCHTALEDAKNTAIMYLKLITMFEK